jgi:probable HAF family extracellular repeat protein
MSKLLKFAIVLLTSFAICACGSGGGGGSDLPVAGDTVTPGTPGAPITPGTPPPVSPGQLGPLTDIGDLVGASDVNWLYTKAVAINDNGQVVGTSLTNAAAFIWNPAANAMTWLGLHMDFVTGADKYYDNYYEPTGTKPFIWSDAVDVNNSGWAIGNSNTGAKDADGNFTEKRAFVSDGATFIDLAPVTRNQITGVYDVIKSYSAAVAINNNGYVILNVEDADSGNRHAYYWNGANYEPGAAPDGSDVPRLVRLGWVNGETSEAIAINENNEAVVNSGKTAVYTNINTGFSQVLNSILNDEVARATDINNKSQIIGTSGKLGFLWEAGAMTRINSLGGDSCTPVDINNMSQVVGSAKAASGATHAFLWQLNASGVPVMNDLGTLGGANSFATAINDAGWVVGYSDVGRTLQDATGTYTIKHAFLWVNGVMYDLGVHNDFYDYPFIDSYPFSEAVGINATGTLVGNSTSINVNSRGFVLTPNLP